MSTQTRTERTIPPHGDYRRYRGSKTFPRCTDGPDGKRCALCRAANAARSHGSGRDGRYRTKLRGQRVPVQWADGTWHLAHPDPPGRDGPNGDGHGTITAATAAGCDCEPCHEVAAQRRRNNRAAARESE